MNDQWPMTNDQATQPGPVGESHSPAPTTPGLRCVCMFCKRDLAHSDRSASRVSHGACEPLCPEAAAYGWKEAA